MKYKFDVRYYKTSPEGEPRPGVYYKEVVKRINFFEWLWRWWLMPIGPALCLPGFTFACVCGAFVEATGNWLWVFGIIGGFAIGILGLSGSMTYDTYDERLKEKYCSDELAWAAETRAATDAVWKEYQDKVRAEEDAKKLLDCYKVLGANDAHALFRLIYNKDIEEQV